MAPPNSTNQSRGIRERKAGSLVSWGFQAPSPRKVNPEAVRTGRQVMAGTVMAGTEVEYHWLEAIT